MEPRAEKKSWILFSRATVLHLGGRSGQWGVPSHGETYKAGKEDEVHFWAVLKDNLHIIKTPVPSECITVLYQLKLLYLISWFNYELVNWKIHGTSSEGQNTQKFKEHWSIYFTWGVLCSAELQKSLLIQTGKLTLGLNNCITKQDDNSLPFMNCGCIYCQLWLVCDWFICMLWFPEDPSTNCSRRNAFCTVLSTPLALSGTCLCLCNMPDWLTCRLWFSLDGRDMLRAWASDSRLWNTRFHCCIKGFFRSCKGQIKYLINNF